MKTLTIRGLPDDVHEGLKNRAKQNRRSLNQEIIAELVETITVVSDAKKIDNALTAVEEFRSELKRTLSKDEIKDAINEGKR